MPGVKLSGRAAPRATQPSTLLCGERAKSFFALRGLSVNRSAVERSVSHVRPRSGRAGSSPGTEAKTLLGGRSTPRIASAFAACHAGGRPGARERSGAARDRGASLSECELERLAAGDVRVVVRREHEAESVDDILARLFARSALTDPAGHLDDPRDDPPVLVGLFVRDRQPKRLAHGAHRSLRGGAELEA